MSALLKKMGARTLTATTPEAAMEHARGKGSEVSLIVCDVQLGSSSGPALVAALARHCDAPVVYVTGYGEDAGLGLEGAEILRKPFSRRNSRSISLRRVYRA